MVITRKSYQEKRLAFVKKFLDPANLKGLEIGACDLPTVQESVCLFADFRTAEEMSTLWELPRETVMPVEFIVNRKRRLFDQIEEKFDYVIACHVIEHVANPIGYIQELAGLLKPNGLIFLAIPDKRCTSDIDRPSTTLEHLLCDYYQDSRYPALEHILEMTRFCLPGGREVSGASFEAQYEAAVANHKSGEADAHCHVWTDGEYFEQMRLLVDGGILKIQITSAEATPPGFNEFMIALRAA